MALADTSIGSFLDALASKTPAPGGGAVAGLCGAVGAALGSMVVEYSKGKKSLAEFEQVHTDALARLSEIRAEMLTLAEEDERAYSKVNALQRLAEDDPARSGLPDAVRAAVDVPARVISLALELLELLHSLADKSNKYLLSDLAIAAVLAEATACAGAWNVRVNAPLAAEVGVQHEGIEAAPGQAEACKRLRAEIEAACA